MSTTHKRYTGASQCGEPIFIVDMSDKHGKDAYKVFPYNLEAAEVYAEAMGIIRGEEKECGAV